MISSRLLNRRGGRASAFLAAIFLVFALAQTRPGQDDRSPAAGLQTALHQLEREAAACIKHGRLERGGANFAAEFPDPIPLELLRQKIVRPLHDDRFTDAYIRWQLTSFEPNLPEMNDREFRKMLDALPSMIANPRCDDDLISALNAAIQAGALSQKQQDAFNRRLNDLADRTSRAAELNHPSLLLRDWWDQQFQNDPARRLNLGLERCAAMVEAGWPVDQAKTKLDEQFTAAARDQSGGRGRGALTADERAAVLAHARRLTGRKNLYVTAAGIRENVAFAEFADTAIYDFDVRRWEKALESKE